eukprot:1181102-Prorocentrum_minimum.AAC.4
MRRRRTRPPEKPALMAAMHCPGPAGERSVERREEAPQSHARLRSAGVRVTQPLNRGDRNGAVEHRLPQREPLAHVAKGQVAIHLTVVVSHLQHGCADVRPEPFVPVRWGRADSETVEGIVRQIIISTHFGERALHSVTPKPLILN